MLQPKSSLSNKPLSAEWSVGCIEQELRRQGFMRIAGVDEAGRGPLAGPVVAACCVLPSTQLFPEIKDSKLLTECERERIYETLTTSSDVHWQVSIVGPDIIDSINIRQATLLAMKEAVLQLALPPEFVLIDGRDTIDIPYSQRAVIKGDRHCVAIGAASIIAKVTRDRLMHKLAEQFPHYGFEKHKGYGTAAHYAAIQNYGATKHHRRSFRLFDVMKNSDQ